MIKLRIPCSLRTVVCFDTSLRYARWALGRLTVDIDAIAQFKTSNSNKADKTNLLPCGMP